MEEIRLNMAELLCESLRCQLLAIELIGRKFQVYKGGNELRQKLGGTEDE